MALLTGQSWRVLKSGYTGGDPEQAFRGWFVYGLNQRLISICDAGQWLPCSQVLKNSNAVRFNLLQFSPLVPPSCICSVIYTFSLCFTQFWWPFQIRGTQREYSSKPLKHRIVKRILVFKR